MVNFVARQVFVKAKHFGFGLFLVATYLLSLALLSSVRAAETATGPSATAWSVGAAPASATGNGVTVTMTPSAAFTGTTATGTMSATQFWNDPFAVAPLTATNSIPGTPDLNFTVNPVTSQTITVTFSKPVDNPVVHVQRMGGALGGGTTNSSNWNLTGSNLGTLPTVSRLSGNFQFKVAGTSFFRTGNVTAGATGCSAASLAATTDDGTNGCGSVQFNGIGITSLTFTVTFLNTVGLGDGMEMNWTIPNSSIIIQKQTIGATNSFVFAGTNGAPSPTLNTATTNPISSTSAFITNVNNPITITETAVPGYVISATACQDQNATAVVSSLAGNVLTVAGAAIGVGKTITCKFTNTKLPTVAVKKTSLGATGTFNFNLTGLSNATDSVITTTSGTAVTSAQLNTGTIGTAASVTETAATATGYSTGAICTDANAATDGVGAASPITVASGTAIAIPGTLMVTNAAWTCAYTNTKPATLKITKISNGAVGAFTFTGDNGWTSQTITTAASGTGVAGATQTLSAVNTATNITEAIPTGYVLASATCTGMGAGGTATVTPATGLLALNAAATAPGSNISCTFTNNKLPAVTITKTSNGGVAPFTFTITPTLGTTSQTITPATAATPTVGTLQYLSSPGQDITITEGAVAGYTLASATCSGLGVGSQTNDLPNRTVAINAAALVNGADIQCTFVNNKVATVKVQKTTVGGFGGPFSFAQTNLASVPAAITTTAAGTTTPASPTAINVTALATDVTLTETPATGYGVASASCTDANSAVTGNTGSFGTLAGNKLTILAANVKPGSDFTCVFTNNKLPTLAVRKISNGGVGPYTFTGDNGWVSQTVTTVTSGTGVTGPVQTLSAASTVTNITEAVPAGYKLSSISCAGVGVGNTTNNLAAGSVQIAVGGTAPGVTAVCTFTNDKLPTVTLTKISNGGVGPFTFTGNNGWTNQTITTTTSGTGVTGATQTLTAPAVATTITETIPAGYALASATCTGLGSGGTATPNLATGAVVLDAAATAAGSNIACTFTNTKLPTVTITKISNGAVGAFTFTGTNGWTSQTITTATSGTGVTGATQVLTAAATATQIAETIPAGYALSNIVCSGAGAGNTTNNLASGTVDITAAGVPAGAAINCTFTNDKLPALTLVKTVTNDNGGSLAANTVNLSATGPSTITGVTGAPAVTSALVPVGTYALSETNPTGYLAGAWSCSSGTLAGSNLTLAAGQVATCTINNNDIQPKLTLIKTVTNDNGGSAAVSAFTLSAVNGGTTISGASGTASVTNAGVNAGTWALSETGPTGYVQGSWVCTTGTLVGSNLTLAPGDSSTCTVNNNDISPKLTLVKQVVNDNGGTLVANTVALTANGPTPITGVTGAGSVTTANVNAGTYTLTEAATPGYTQGAWSCNAGTLTGNSLVLALNQIATCTIINNDTAPLLTLVKTITNDNGGTVAANTVSLTAAGPVSVAGVSGSPAVTAAAVNAGTYALSEANPAGYAAGAWSCTGGTLTGSSLVLALGQTATCTINNNDISPVLTLTKTVTNDNGGTVAASSVNLTATGPTTITGNSGSATVTNAAVNPGTYTLTEVNPTGYSASAWSCTAGTLTGNSLVLALGQSANCTINDNDVSPTLTLVKTVTNDDGGTLVANTVNLTATGPTTITGVTGNAAVTSASVNAGSYALSEATVPGYTASAWSCSAGTLSGANLTLSPGQSATCTINNNDIAPKLTLVKTITNDDGGAAAASAFSLSATGPATITGTTGSGAVTNANVRVGTYALSETGPAGYAAGSWSCSAGTLVGNNLTLAAGAVATCTINNNDIAPVLTLVKTVTNDNGGTLAANTVSLSAVGPVSIAGVTGAGAVTSATVKAGTYALSEANPAGYAAGAWSCTAGTLSGSNLTLANGQTATCTINDNDISPVLTLSKTVTNDNGGVAAVSAFPLTATGPTTITGVNGAVAVTAASVNAGVYTLSETGPAGYTAGAWSCSAGTLAGNSLTLTPGQTAVCSINNNDDAAKLTLVKTITNDNGGSNVIADFTLKATGPTTISGVSANVAVTNANVNAGPYALSETGPAGYLASAWSCTAGTLTGSSLVLGSGQNATCTLNNNDIAPKLTLVKTVTNSYGGVATVPDFTLTATGPSTITGVTAAPTVTNAIVNVGTYVLSETGPPGYSAGAWSCTAGTLTGNSLVLGLNQNATCTINNADISPKLTLVKTITNNSGGSNVAADFVLKATGPSTITGATGSASVTNANVNVGTYALSETGPSGYTAAAWSCVGGSLSGSNLTLALNQSATCTLNNDDTPATIVLNKISNGGTGTFNFNGTNGVGAQSITTTTAGTAVATSPITLTASSTATTITETIPTGYGLTAASCTGIGSGTATPNLLTGALVLDAAATAPGSAVNCTFTNGVASYTVSKSASASSVAAPGPVTYTITVVNTGLASMTSPAISDTLTLGGSPRTLTSGPTLASGDNAPTGVLNVGETWVYTATYNVTQADIDAGGTLSNTATFSTQQTAPVASAPATTTLTQTPKLTIDKQVDPTTLTFSAVGNTIKYNFVVLNSGNTTITSQISITDPKISPAASCPLPGAGLAPGQSVTCTGTSVPMTQADLDLGSFTNNATATDGTTTSLPDAVTVPASQNPNMSVAKTTATAPPTSSFTAVGDKWYYRYDVTNTGNVTMVAPINVTDNVVTPHTFLCSNVDLSPGSTVSCTAFYTVTLDDLTLGSITNLASATSANGTSPQISLTIPPASNPALTIQKSSPTLSFNAAGTTITYKYRIINSGGATFTSARPIQVVDDKIGTFDCFTPAPTFLPGAFFDCADQTYIVSQAEVDAGFVTNQAYALTTYGGAGPVGNIVVASPPKSVTVNAIQNPVLTVTKSVAPAVTGVLGQSLTYTIKVKNDGNVTASDITVTDPLIPSLSCAIATLAPAASDNSCTGIYIVKQSDIDLGRINNTAAASGKAPLGNPVTGSGSLITSVPQVTTMSVAKALTSNADGDASSSITLGDVLNYSVTATNTGTVTQTNVQVADTKITPNNKTCATVAPNASCILSGTYTVTQADVDAGTIGNTGSFTSDIITAPQTTTINTPVAQSSLLTLAKVKTGFTNNDANPALTVGDSVAYTITATNAGTVTQTSVVVSDPLLTPPSITCPTLAPAATCVLSGTHIVTAGEATSGQVVNTGSVTSTLITSPVTSSVTTPVTRIIIATNDTPSPTNGASGAANVVNAYNNDTLNGVTATPANITGTVLAAATPINSGPVPALDVATGIVSVPAGTPAGSYTIQYQICETAVPINCAVANITVPVSAAPVVAADDSVPGINGATGATGVTNAFNGDTVNGSPATTANSTLSANTAVPLQLAFNTSTGAVDVLPNTPAGTYTFDYKICEKLNPTNCKIATISVTVVAAPLVANNDTPAATNGANGNPSLIDAYANDTLNGAPVSTGTITGTIVTPATSIGGKPVPVMNPATGIVSVPAGTPAGTYTITYQICEQLNPVSNCKTATVTVPVTAAPIVAGNDTPAPINGANGSTISSVLANDTFNGLPIVPAAITLSTVTNPAPGFLTLNSDGTITVAVATPAGTYTYSYKICENLNPLNCSTATVTIVIEAAPIVATNDNPASINGANGGSTPTVLANDSLNGAPVVPAAITLTPGSAPTPAAGSITMNLDGTITVAAGTTAGTYSYPYTICENLNSTNCASAIATVVVTAAPIIAANDIHAPINGKTGAANVIDAYANDSLNGAAIVPAKINATILSPATPLTAGANVPTMVAGTGLVSVPADTPAGTYSITYQICEKLNPLNCATAVVTVDVAASAIVANADSNVLTPVNGAAGNPTAIDAYANDTLNGSSVVLGDITGTVTTPATPVFAGANVPLMDAATGNVSVPAGTPAGSYTIAYKICEKLNPTNCSNSTVTVVVAAAPVVATNDTASGVNGFTGATAVVNAFTADTINGQPATTANSTLAFEPTVGVPTVPAGLTFNASTGNVDVVAGTQAGTYSFSYKLCEKLNPTNCQVAVISVTVDAAAIAANIDAPPSVNGATGNPSMIDAFANDTLNGAPLIANTFTGSVTTPATPVYLGAPVPALDPSTGNVAVPAGTPAGTYVITYKICENLNPSNCASNTVTVVVDPSAVVATNDAASNINGANGATAVANAFTGDTVNGQPATAANAILSFEPTVGVPTLPAGLVFNTSTGNVDVSPSTPAGTYVFSYKICEKLNPTNCQIATITVDVVAAPIVANADTPLPVNGANGNPSLVNAYANDTLNGVAATPSTITGSVVTAATPAFLGAAVPVLDVATGNVSVPVGTPAGTYTIAYKICEQLNPTNCSNASITVAVTAPPIMANTDFAPATNGLIGNPSVENVYTNDLLNGVAVTASAINGTVLTPATSIGGKPVPTLDVATGVVSVPAGTPAGSYTIQYQICDKLNPTNCSSAVVTIPVEAAQIVALNDTPTAVNGVNGNANIANAFTNDTLNGSPVVINEITASVLTGATPATVGAPVPLLNVTTGVVSVPANTPAGNYTITYQICENLNPTNCAPADIIVVVDPSPIIVTNDSATGVNGLTGAPNVLGVFADDTINGAAATSANAILSVGPLSTLPPQLTFNTTTGSVGVVAGTPAGVYTFDYQICEKLNPTNCKTATVSVTVDAAAIAANPDVPATVNGADGNPTLVNAFTNDTLNGILLNSPAQVATITGTVIAPATPINGGSVPSLDVATGVVSVPAGTPAGSYTIDYKICENLNPSNCSTSTVTVAVSAAPIVATNDTPGSTNGFVGNPTLVNAYANDTLNNVLLDTLAKVAKITGTVTAAATPINAGPVPTLDVATGVVSVPAGTPAGTYTIAYQICETLNLANCSNATITVPVGLAPIAAVLDTPAPVNGATGSANVVNAFANDTLNGAAVVTTEITATVLNPASPITVGAPIPVLDVATGIVSVPAGTPAGSYTIRYQICENLNSGNCSAADITVLVDPSSVVATNDSATGVNGLTGAANVLNVFSADTINGVAATSGNANISLAPLSTLPPQLTFDAAGNVSVVAGTPVGIYTFDYQICEKLNPANCKTANVSVTVGAAIIAAVADTPSPVNGATGNTNVVDAFANDTLNVAPVVATDITATVLTPATPIGGGPVPTLDPVTGIVSVPAGTPASVIGTPYLITYKICENLNPGNCSQNTITVVVDPSAIVATGDSVTGVNGLTGAANVLNVFSADTINGVAATSGNANISIAPLSTLPPQLTFDTATGNVSVVAGTTAGTYTFDYQICEKLNPANCKPATVSVTVGTAVITANPDAPSAINGATGNANVINAFANDTLNGVLLDTPAKVATITATVVTPATAIGAGPIPTLNPVTGVVSVPAGTPASPPATPYVITYKICENLNPTNCSQNTITVIVDPALLVATADTPAAVNGTSGNANVVNAFANDTLNGVAVTTTTITASVVSGATPVTAGALVPVLDQATGIVSVPAGTPASAVGTPYVITYKICENLNPTNCKNATITVQVDPPAILAVADPLGPVNGATGNANVADAFANDKLNGLPVVLTEITASVVTFATPVAAGAPVPALDVTTGIVSVPPNTPAGTYTIGYKICENLNPANCSLANVTVVVDPSTIVATADTATGVNGLTGATNVLNVFTGDTINGVAASLTNANISLAPLSTLPPQLTFDAAGNVSVVAGTPVGTYTFDYQICEKLNPTNCKTATVSVTVGAAIIAANPDAPTAVNGTTGSANIVNAFDNDTLNGVFLNTPAQVATIKGRVVTPAVSIGGGPIPSLDPNTGIVSVPAGTPASPLGTPYVITYEICEKLNPLNCKNSTVTVVVDPPVIAAGPDTPPSIIGAAGGSTPSVLANDMLNGSAVTVGSTGNSTLAPGAAPSPTVGSITMNADGTITVAPGTTAGSYPYSYTICEKLNPANCSTTIATVVVDQAAINAAVDTTPTVNGATGGSTPSVLANDTLNGAPVVLSAITLTPGAPPAPAAGSITMNPDGTVTIAPGTTAGSYPFSYTICEKANILNCSTVTSTIVVGVAPIVATADIPAAVNGATGSPNIVNAFANDTLNGALLDTPAKVATINATVTTPAVSIGGGPVPTLDPATGIVSVPAGTPASPPGSPYVITYQICEKLNPGNCQSASVTVVVNPPLIVAATDNPLPAGPATTFDTKLALTNIGNVLTNDTLDGVTVTPASVDLTVVGTLPPGITLNPDGSIDLAQFTASGTYTFQYQICEKLNPTNCKIATVTIPVKKTVPAVSGTVFFDTNGNGVKDGAEQVLPGYTVELVLNGVVVDSTLTAIDGTYSIFGFPPASGYQLIFKNPSGLSVGSITGLDFTNSTILTNVNQPIDPSGVIYNSITGLPVAGAVVTMTSGGVALPAACLLPGQQTQTTGANGQYRFDIVAGADPACPVGPTVYTIIVVSPANYLPAPSTIYAPQGGSLNADACAIAPAACLVSPSATAPPAGTTQPYYFSFLLQAGSPNVINNHIPLDPILAGTAAFTKTALKTEVHRGERVPYVIQATAMNFPKANVVDIIPPGFDFVPGSALVNGVPATPTINGNQLTFSNITANGGALKVELTLIANAAVQPGPATNKAQLLNFFTNNLVANARATVTVVADPVFDCGEIIGRVFEDANRNGYQDQGEKGLPGVRIATVKGLLVTTDKFGRFHVACADIPDHSIGSNFLMKLDTRTLPTGYRLTTENPRDVRLTAGKMTKLNFGASIAHLVDLDLNGKVFKPGSTELLPQWNAGLGTLIAKLAEEPSTLRLTYHTEKEPTALAAKRLAAVSALITKLWSNADGSYDLPIETRSVDAKGGAQ